MEIRFLAEQLFVICIVPVPRFPALHQRNARGKPFCADASNDFFTVLQMQAPWNPQRFSALPVEGW
jgi:hypothetical protein